MEGHGVGERERLRVGKELGQVLRELGARPRRLAEQLESRGDHRVDVGAVQLRRERTAEGLAEDRQCQRMDREAVARRDEVERRAHQPRAHGLALRDQVAQLLRPEALDPRPERHIRVLGHLRLHADEPLDHLDRRRARALEEALALEQGAPQRPLAQDRLRHG